MVKIAIVEDHTLFREGVKTLLQKITDFKVIAEYANGKDFIGLLDSIDPDIVLMDIEMPIMNGLEAAKQAFVKKPGLKIIVLSMYSDKQYYYEMILAGVAGFIIKDASVTQLEKAIREVYSGMSFFSPELIQKAMVLSNEVNDKQRKINDLQLTNRETEVLDLICEGLSNNEISERLFLSPKTIESHKNKLMQKTDCKNTASLIIYAIKNQLVKL
jgi:DNA-binding NarL/FixJ family response regulator